MVESPKLFLLRFVASYDLFDFGARAAGFLTGVVPVIGLVFHAPAGEELNEEVYDSVHTLVDFKKKFTAETLLAGFLTRDDAF